MANKNDKKDKANSVALKKALKFYILPLVSMTLFILIVIVLIVPKIGEVFSKLDELSQDDATYTAANNTLAVLKTANEKSNELLAQLQVVNETTPTGKTEVVKFRDKITELIQKNHLRIVSQQLSENNLTDEEETTSTEGGAKLRLQEVPFTFQIKGNYTSLVAFIKDLSVIEDFVIVKQMILNSSVESDLRLTINKYQFNKLSLEDQATLFSSVPIDAEPSKNVIDYVNSKLQ